MRWEPCNNSSPTEWSRRAFDQRQQHQHQEQHQQQHQHHLQHHHQRISTNTGDQIMFIISMMMNAYMVLDILITMLASTLQWQAR